MSESERKLELISPPSGERLRLAFEAKQRPTPEWFVEPQDSADYFPGEPTPLNPYLNSAVKQHQFNVAAALYSLTTERAAPEGTPPGIIEMIEHNFMHSQVRLDASNYKSYDEVINGNEPLSDRALLLMDKAAPGKATIAEILDLIEDTQLKNGELGKITHPYGYRMEHVPELHSRVIQAILEKNGILHPQITPYRDVKLHPHYTYDKEDIASEHPYLNGMVATYKHDIGWIDIGDNQRISVVERQTAGIRIDPESGFNQIIAGSMRSFKPGTSKLWLSEMLRKSNCDDYVEAHIQRDTTKKFLIPLSTVIYAYKNDVEPRSKHSARVDKLAAPGAQAAGMLVVNRQAE